MSEQRPENQNSQGPGGPRRDEWWEGRREWRRDWRGHDPFRGLFPGLVLVMLGVLLFFATRGTISWGVWWQYFLIGLGVIFLLDGLVHYLFGHHGAGRFIPGVILVLVGTAFVIGFSEWWPLVLVGVGVAILLGMLFRRG
jgi:hypothetical protein